MRTGCLASAAALPGRDCISPCSAVAALWLPIGLTDAVPPSEGSPVFWVPWFLISSIGLLFFIVSAQAPLMQRWYALETSRGDPYPLYAASNLGSFAGLISYPLLVEPLMSLQQQSWLWTALYACLVVLVALCAFTVPADAVESAPEETTPAPTELADRALDRARRRAVGADAVDDHASHHRHRRDAPALGASARPLSAELRDRLRRPPRARPTSSPCSRPLIILIAGGLAFSDGTRNPFVSATPRPVAAARGRGRAACARCSGFGPAVDHLTRFYLAMSFGGMLGGLFCAIVAPLVFDWAYEHPLLILAAALLRPANRARALAEAARNGRWASLCRSSLCSSPMRRSVGYFGSRRCSAA